MAHNVNVNMKNQSITRQLSSAQIPKRGNLSLPEAGQSTARSTPPVQKAPTTLSYDEHLFSGTESEMTEEEQLDFATPVSSRSETPPPANVKDLHRCVTIMQEISAQDVALFKELTAVREIAARLRKRARNVRDLVKAEIGRRERMEVYFRYWQEIEPRWDREWLYGEKRVRDKKDADKATSLLGRKPVLSPEQLKLKRQEIVSKQEAEQRLLEALQERGMRGGISS